LFVLVPPPVLPVPAPVLPVPPVAPVPALPVPPVLALPVPPVAAPVPPVAAPEVPDVPPVLGVTAPEDEDVPDEVEGAVVLDGEELVAVSLGDEDDPLLEPPEALPIEAFSGATSSGVVLGTTSCATLLPPQADRPPVARSIRPMAAARRRTREMLPAIRPPTERSAAPCAGRTSGSR
jgi:hypothetical protein